MSIDDHAIDGGFHNNTRTVLQEVMDGRRSVTQEQLNADAGYVQIKEAMEMSAALGHPIPLRVAISPITARWLLSGNSGNRAFSETTAAKYSKDMSAGQWHENGDGLSISSEGATNNGQHRLVAIEHSGATIMTNVTVGLTRASRSTNDIGLIRTLSSILAMAGIDNASTIGAMTRLVIGWEETGSASIRPARETSNLQVEERIKHDPALVASAKYADNIKKRARHILSPSQIGFLHYILGKRSPEGATAFMNALATGAEGTRGLNTTDPRYVVRERLAKDLKILTPANRVELVFRAWNMWRKGQTVAKFIITGNTPELAG